MNVAVAVILIGAIVALTIGIVTALATVAVNLTPALDVDRPVEDSRPKVLATGPVYWSYALWTIALGMFLMAAPPRWYGPSWSYFPQLPHNGFGMGLCCTILASLLVLALRLNAPARTLSILFFLIGFVYWTSGVILGAEGLFGHMGLMETPFMCYAGVHAFAHSAVLMAHHRVTP